MHSDVMYMNLGCGQYIILGTLGNQKDHLGGIKGKKTPL